MTLKQPTQTKITVPQPPLTRTCAHCVLFTPDDFPHLDDTWWGNCRYAKQVKSTNRACILWQPRTIEE